MTEADVRRAALAVPANRAILERLADLRAPQAMLTAGCLFQPVWNARCGLPPDHGIRDHDVFYWDADTSEAAEDRVIQRAARLFADLGVTVEVRNQARVHLWYAAHFGAPCPPLPSARAGVDRFLILATCVGIEAGGALYAPYGLADLAAGVLRPNPANDQPALFAAKAASYRERWPWLTVAS